MKGSHFSSFWESPKWVPHPAVPPDKALGLCVDEKSQVQPLDRTQPGLPMKKGRWCGTLTHDCKRNGIPCLFAALNVLDCTVTGTCYPRQWFVEITRKKSGAGSLKAFRSWWLSSKASSGSTTTPIPNRSSGPGMSRRLWTRSVVSVVVKPLLRHYNRYFGASFVFSEKMHLNPIIMKMRGVFKRENFSLEFSS